MESSKKKAKGKSSREKKGSTVSEKVKEKSKRAIKETTPVGGAFGHFFTLQAGTVMCCFVILGLASVSFLYNLSAPNDTKDNTQLIVQYSLATLYVASAFIGTCTVSTGSLKRSTKLVLVGTIIVTIAAVYWFFLAIFGFIPRAQDYVCISDRCPSTSWLLNMPLPGQSNNSFIGKRSEEGNVIDALAHRNKTFIENDYPPASSWDGSTVPPAGCSDPSLLEAHIYPLLGYNVIERGNVLDSKTKPGYRSEMKTRDRRVRLANESDPIDFGSAISSAKTINASARDVPLLTVNDASKQTYLLEWINSSFRVKLSPVQDKRIRLTMTKSFKSSLSLSHSKAEHAKSSYLAMSIFCTVTFALFLAYGLWAMFCLYKEEKMHLQRQTIEEDSSSCLVAQVMKSRSKPMNKSSASTLTFGSWDELDAN